MRATLIATLCAALLLPAVLAGAEETAAPRPGYAATPAEAAIRPGSPVGTDDLPDAPLTEADAYCTYNWVFHDVVAPDPVTGATPEPKAYIGTAAHCTDAVGERMSLVGYGEFGTVVYDSDDVDSAVDFTLIEIDADKVADTHPQMLGFEAPTGFAVPADLAVGDLVGIHGYGVALGMNDVTRTREGVLVGHTDDEYVADMPAVNGDSGSPLVLSDSGLALGIISRYGFSASPPSTDTGPLIPWILEHLADAGFTVELATVDG
jgi:hypothetical protein